ncbi:MAG: integration host factor subunit alpha [Zetaproteobacteria bacterium]|nr:MAG: integration host factor subunit alpha [Zetaproteobacteria bacterium]
MTKADIVKAVYRRIGISKSESAQLVDDVLETIRRTLEGGEDVKLSGFGHFALRDKGARIGRNPKTGEEIMISPRRVVTFRASPIMKNRINGK